MGYFKAAYPGLQYNKINRYFFKRIFSLFIFSQDHMNLYICLIQNVIIKGKSKNL